MNQIIRKKYIDTVHEPNYLKKYIDTVHEPNN